MEKTWADKVPLWGMMKNDTIGDCTCASAGHLIMNWSASASTEKIPDDQAILDAYIAITKYNPQTGANDNGAAVVDVLDFWRKTGIKVDGNMDQIEAYVSLEPKNTRQLKESVFLFGGCYLGISLPVTAKDQKIWSVPPSGAVGHGAQGSWGGHAVPVVGYDERYVAIITWGNLLYMTWEFYNTYCDEAYAIISKDWINSADKSPAGFDMVALERDLNEITKEPDTILADFNKYTLV